MTCSIVLSRHCTSRGSRTTSIKAAQVKVHRLPPPPELLAAFVQDPEQGPSCIYAIAA